MLGEFCPQIPAFRLTFSQIKCQIKMQDLSILALAAKIGKNYSQTTTKTELKNGCLTFPNSISIPISEDLVYDKNPRKEKVNKELMKCEVMIYRFYPEPKQKVTQAKDLTDSNITKKQKEKKNLIGMTSLLISGQLLSEKVKTFRITNTFDKEATITCHVKICHDIFNCSQDKISSIDQRSNASSTPKGIDLRNDKPLKNIYQMVKAQKQLNSKYKTNNIPELDMSRMSQRNKPISSIEMGIYSERHMADNYEESELTKTQRIHGFRQQIFSGRIRKNQRNVQSYSENYERKDNKHEQNQDIFQLCNNLQQQNNLLMNKIQNLQNHILNKSPSGQRPFPDQAKLNKTQSLIKPSMIKKNNKFITSASTTFTKQSNPKSITSTIQNNEAQQKGRQSPKILPNESNFSFKPTIKMISIKQMDLQYESSKIITPRSHLAQKISFGSDQNSKTTQFQNVQPKDSRFRSFKIGSVIEVTYVPPIPPIVREFSESSKSRNNKVQKSISSHERSFSRSYTKFNHVKRSHIEKGQKNFSILRDIEKKDFGIQAQIDKLPNVPNMKKIPSQLETPFFVTINGIAGQGNIPKIQSQNQQKNVPIKVFTNSQRSTLQDVNRLIEQRYRKTEKYLKIANEQLIQQNQVLKRENKQLAIQLKERSHVSSNKVPNYQSESGNQEMEIKYYIKLVSQREEQIENLNKKLHEVNQEKENLQKLMRQQKKTAAYFIKTSHYQDQQQKDLQMKLKLIQQQFNIHDSAFPSDSNNTKSQIIMPSPKVIYHSSKKLFSNQEKYILKKDQKGYVTQRNNNPITKMPQIRFSVTRMDQLNQKNTSNIIPFSKSQILTDNQNSVQSKGLSSLKKRSALNTNRTIDLTRQPNQFQNTFQTLFEKANTKQMLINHQNFTQRKNLSINTKL